MIIKEISNSAPENLQTMLCKLDACTVPSIEEFERCDCDCFEGCLEKFPVFAKVGGTDKQNDKSSFLYRVLTATDTGSIKLLKKNGNEFEELATLNSATYGTFYDFGTWSQYTDQDLYFGYELEWLSVFTAHGRGEYQIKAELTVTGSSVEKFSQIFVLEEYTDRRADGTVKIQTVQNGDIRRSQFDFTGMEWNQYVRLKGFFGFRTPEFITEEYLTNDYKEEQIQDEIRDEYTLEIESFLEGEVLEDFIYTRLLANEIFVTDYNLCNTNKAKFCDFPVKMQSFEQVFEDRYRKGSLYSLKFTDRFKDNFKRNYK